MKIYITQISKKIKGLREERKLTQEELADQLGISRQSIISVEKGKCLPSLPLALRISEIFEQSLEEIFTNSKNLIRKEEEKTMPHFLSPFFDEEETMPAAWPQRVRGIAFPAVNVKQTQKDVILTADIPGIKEDELQIEVGDDFVDISGERREEEHENPPAGGEGYFRQEVRYGSFARRIPLPATVIADKAEAIIKNGLLQLTLPKVASSKPKVTKIKVKKA